MRRIERLRNIGVLAHVDAGKTTLTERLLYAAGRLHRMGEVHDGAAAMDSRSVEKAHGVTVSAAATSVDWRDHRVNLVDTPGHVDFAWEVERALLAIDSAVILFSATAGVEPQTETVWAQTGRAGLPRIGFVNKMDAVGADFAGVLAMAQARLEGRFAAVHWPVLDEAGALLGVLDLVEPAWATWPRAGQADREALHPTLAPVPAALEALCAARREALIEAAVEAALDAGDPDEAAIADYLGGRGLDAARLRGLVRRACLARRLTPVLAGAAYRGIGATGLLDAVVAYGPSPADRGPASGVDPGTGAPQSRPAEAEAPFSALVSKIAVTRYGPQATLRVLSGRIASGDRALIAASGEIERVGRLIAPHAAGGEDVAAAEAGDIVVVAGLKSAEAGDSLCDPAAPIALAGLARPEPAVAAAIEPVTAADQDRLRPALAAMAREDPSLRVETDAETGELVLAGMGELHLAIAVEALAQERGVAARIGPPRIAYRETVAGSAEVEHTLRKQSGGPGQFARLRLRLEPAAGAEILFEDRSAGGAVPAEYVAAVETAVRAAASEGVLAGFPAQGLKALLLDGAHHPVDSSAMAFAAAARAAFREAFRAAEPQLLEPVAELLIRVPEADLGAVIGDLERRRGQVLGLEAEAIGQSGAQRLRAEAPMAELWGYVGALRSQTKGRGQASIRVAAYAPAPAALAARLAARQV